MRISTPRSSKLKAIRCAKGVTEERDEHFYQIAALQCSLLSELARASYEYHEQMAKSGMATGTFIAIRAETWPSALEHLTASLGVAT